MTPITSHHNDRLKEIRRLTRSRRERERVGRFVAEGEDLLAAADAAGWAASERYCATGSGLAGVEVEPAVLGRVSGLGSGTRALAVFTERWAARPTAPCVYLHGVRDPGNVGTVLRSAVAFGAASVALGPDCADPYGPKAVRASMGAVFRMPLIHVGDAEDLPAPRVGLAARRGDPLEHALAGPGTILVGAERDGLPEAVLATCERVAHIPIESESLNAAMAATVALYEAARVHRMGHR